MGCCVLLGRRLRGPSKPPCTTRTSQRIIFPATCRHDYLRQKEPWSPFTTSILGFALRQLTTSIGWRTLYTNHPKAPTYTESRSSADRDQWVCQLYRIIYRRFLQISVLIGVSSRTHNGYLHLNIARLVFQRLRYTILVQPFGSRAGVCFYWICVGCSRYCSEPLTQTRLSCHRRQSQFIRSGKFSRSYQGCSYRHG